MRKSIVLACVMWVPMLAVAAEEARVGVETRAWSALQLDGKSASQVPRPMSGDIAERVYERYANSFAHPIPEKLEQDDFVTSGGK